MALSVRRNKRHDPSFTAVILPFASNATIPSSMLCTTLASSRSRARISSSLWETVSRVVARSFSISRNDATSVFASARAMGSMSRRTLRAAIAPMEPVRIRSRRTGSSIWRMTASRVSPRLLISRISRITSPTSLSFSRPAYRVTTASMSSRDG